MAVRVAVAVAIAVVMAMDVWLRGCVAVWLYCCGCVLPGPSTTTLGHSIDRIEMNIESIESKKHKMQLSKELS